MKTEVRNKFYSSIKEIRKEVEGIKLKFEEAALKFNGFKWQEKSSVKESCEEAIVRLETFEWQNNQHVLYAKKYDKFITYLNNIVLDINNACASLSAKPKLNKDDITSAKFRIDLCLLDIIVGLRYMKSEEDEKLKTLQQKKDRVNGYC